MAPRASSSFLPSARITGEGSSEPDEHAEPVETAMPCRSRFINNPSPSIKRKEIFEIPVTRFSPSLLPPLKIMWGIPAEALLRSNDTDKTRDQMVLLTEIMLAQNDPDQAEDKVVLLTLVVPE